jgi:transcriptional regulator with XRE-family HTH domain
MQDLIHLGDEIARNRRLLELSQLELAAKAHVSRATLDALENHRTREIGFSKLVRILAALGLELSLHEAATRRPTLDDLMQEDRDDQNLDRRS